MTNLIMALKKRMLAEFDIRVSALHSQNAKINIHDKKCWSVDYIAGGETLSLFMQLQNRELRECR